MKNIYLYKNYHNLKYYKMIEIAKFWLVINLIKY